MQQSRERKTAPPRPTRRGTPFRAAGRVVGLACAAALLAAGCATTGDVKELGQTNQTQNQRLAALEASSSRELRRLSDALAEAQDVLRTTEGRLINLTAKVEQMAGEQAAMSEALERSLSQNRALRERIAEQQKAYKTLQTEQKKDLDAMRLRLGDIELLMKTSISHLPLKTKADRLFREAFTHMVSGELDFAAEKFGKFAEAFPKDERVPESKYRAGQAFFLMRKYDHAIVPFFELVDKYPKHRLAVDARWMLARSLEETGDLKLAREFYAQLIAENTVHKADATRRVYFINELYPNLKAPPGAKKAAGGAAKAKKP